MDIDPPAARSTPPAAGPVGLPVLPAAKAAKSSGYLRAIEVGLRSLHILSMGLVLGGIAMGGTYQTLRLPIFATLTTGLLLLATSVRSGCLDFTKGAGSAMFLKFALLGLGNVFEGARLEWYGAATLVTSVGSHMPSAWRHFPVFERLRALVGKKPRPA